jgi:hypothetical protein
LPDLEIEPVVILLVPHPATQAASVMAAVARSTSLVVLIERLLDMKPRSPICPRP